MTDHKGPAIRTRPRWQVWHVVMITILVCFTIVMFRLANTAPDATAPNTQAASSKEAVAGPVDKGTAASACMDAVTPMLAQPRSADFHAFTDTTFHTDGMRARFTIGLTAKNGLGLPIDATAACIFEGETLTSAELLPAGS